VQTFGTLIYFRCRAPGHQQLAVFDGPDLPSPITFRNGHWAYCPAGAASDHDWVEITPTALDQTRVWKAPERRQSAA
jgi:hypothetical protein